MCIQCQTATEWILCNVFDLFSLPIEIECNDLGNRVESPLTHGLTSTIWLNYP